MAWEDLLQRPGQSNGLAEFLLNARQMNDQHALATPQLQFANAQAQEATNKAARDQQFQGDWAQYQKNPTPEALLNLQGKYPEKAQGLSKIYDAKDAAARTSDLGFFGSLYSSLKPDKTGKLTLGTDGKPLAATVLSQRIAADKAAGHDTSEEEQYLQLIQGGDANAANTLRGLVLPHLAAAAGPDKFASTFGVVTKPDEGFTLGPGAKRYDSSGNVVATAPFAPQYRTVGPDSTLVQVGGGGQASGAGGGASAPLVRDGVTYAPAGKTRFGWTPWQGNGGDNSTEAYVGKIDGMAKALGVGPNDDISKLSPLQIAKALTLSEGGPGSIADKNNNPGNIKNPDGSFKKFPTKDAGLNAAAAQVARNLKRGQTSIATMVGGLPAAGDAAPQGDAKVLYTGAGNAADPTAYAPGTSVGGMSADAIDRAAQSYNMTGKLPVGLGRRGDVQRAILSRAAQFAGGASVGDQIGDQAGRAADVAALKKLEGNSANILSFERTALRNGALALRLSARNDNGGVPIFNSWVNVGRRATGDPNISSFDAAVETFANEYAKVTTSATGGGVTSDSAREHARSLINTAQSPEQFISVIQTLAEDMRNRRRGLQSQRQEILNRISGPKSAQPSNPSSGWGKATRVQ